MQKTKKAFLICPVRGHSLEETEETVRWLESGAWSVHWPPRDTDQNDNTGYRICVDNRTAIEQSDVVFVIWDGKSQGCLFDLGMAFALRKSVLWVTLPPESRGKSFQNMIRDWGRVAISTDVNCGG
jgi:nucleoside 2-deoxyribosyltransferase